MARIYLKCACNSIICRPAFAYNFSSLRWWIISLSRFTWYRRPEVKNEKRWKKRLFSWSYSRDLAGSGEKSRITSSLGHSVVMPGLLNADAGWPEIIWRFTSFLTWNVFHARLSDVLFLSGTRRLLTFSTRKGGRRHVGGKTGETRLLPLLFF